MFLIYRPDGGEEQRFEFKPGRVRQSRAEMIERRYTTLAGKAKTWDEFQGDIIRGSASARRVLLWHLLSETHPALRIEDVDPYADELELQFSKTELEDMRAQVAKATSVPEAEKELMLAKLDEEIESAPDAEGKAPSPS